MIKISQNVFLQAKKQLHSAYWGCWLSEAKPQPLGQEYINYVAMQIRATKIL